MDVQGVRGACRGCLLLLFAVCAFLSNAGISLVDVKYIHTPLAQI